MVLIHTPKPKLAIAKVLAVLMVLGLALYFRTYPVQGLSAGESRDVYQKAKTIVLEMMKKQIQAGIETGLPGMSAKKKEELINQKIEEIFRGQRGQFDASVSETTRDLLKARKTYYSPQYLSEADPYYYFELTQNLLKTGQLGRPNGKGGFFNPLRHTPHGNWDVFNLHPYVGLWTYQVIRYFHHGITLMKAVSFVPLVLTVVIAFAYFLLCRTLAAHFFPTFIGALMLLLSPMIIQRTTFAWYDTDPYNILFPILILATFFEMIKSRKNGVLLGCAGGFLSGFFSLFWNGWGFIFFLLSASAFALSLTVWLDRKREASKPFWQYAGAYFFSSIVFGMLFSTPAGFYESISNGILFITKASTPTESFWPNFFMMIGETNPVSPQKWVYLVSNHETVLLALVGILATVYRLRRGRESIEFKQGLALIFVALPLFVLSFKAERYTLLVILPATLFAVIGVEWVRQFLLEKLGHFSFRDFPRKFYPALVALIISLATIPRILIGADVAGRISHTIMNDAWYEPLRYVRDSTPKDSIVFSWWPPGHFITSIAERRTATDGGGQLYKENYWIAKALMSSDEREVCGIFRMLAAGGNDSAEFLEREGVPAGQAIELILRTVPWPRPKAKAGLPANWSEEKKEKFLDLTHGKGAPPPSYLMVYDDLMNNNVILQMIARWDFGKAEKVFRQKKNFAGLFGFLYKNAVTDYIQKMLEITGQPLPYQAPAHLVQHSGPRLIFDDGLMVDFETKSAVLPLPEEKGMSIEPVNLIYPDENGSWIQKESLASRHPVTAALIPVEGSMTAVLAHPDLMRTSLFQLYYFDGARLEYFRPLVSKYDPSSKTWVKIYTINWPQFDRG